MSQNQPTPDTARHTPASMDGNPTIDERANHCFGCGPANPQGLHLTFTTDTSNPEAITTTCHFQLDRMHEGPPGHIHGGIVATLLDEAMSKLNRPLNVIAMTRHMEIDYLRPAPLYKPLVLIGRHLNRPTRADGTLDRKIFHQAEIRTPEGTVLARSKGLFIVIDPKLLAAAGFTAPED
ncbi:PaaI family thioesterase [Granulicella sp. S190]|uniref:PaaI family thioesterase n=1 Tax=Granulicella sp. S190 TaxID=1747226 RepID=UPI00131C141C|nr:PaaI family thioesterase [Granulicella sp. S190]